VAAGTVWRYSGSSGARDFVPAAFVSPNFSFDVRRGVRFFLVKIAALGPVF